MCVCVCVRERERDATRLKTRRCVRFRESEREMQPQLLVGMHVREVERKMDRILEMTFTFEVFFQKSKSFKFCCRQNRMWFRN